MKIFYKKDYEEKVQEIEELKKQLKTAKTDYETKLKQQTNISFEYLESKGHVEKQLEKSKQENKNLRLENQQLKERISELSLKYRKATAAKGGYTLKINKLKEDLKKATAIITDLSSDRYRVIKVRPATNHSQKINLRNAKRNSQVQKILKEKTLEESK